MKKFIIIIFLIINAVQAMEKQVNWSLLPKELWLEILQFVIGDGQNYSNRLNNYKSAVLTSKLFLQLMQTDKIQNLMKKHVYAEVETLCKPITDEEKHRRTSEELRIALLQSFVADSSKYMRVYGGNTPIEKAIEKDKLAYIYFYLKDHPEKLNDPIDASGNTMLHLAARFFQYHRIFNFLLVKNPNVNIQNSNNETPLHAAVIGRRLDDNYRVLRLKEKGANLYIRDYTGMSPLEIIAEHENTAWSEGIIYINSSAQWSFVNELIPQEHKLVLDIQSVSDHSQLLQLHQLFGPEEPPSKLSVKRKR